MKKEHKFATESEKTAYQAGMKTGMVQGQKYGFRRAILALQIMSMGPDEFEGVVIQNRRRKR